MNENLKSKIEEMASVFIDQHAIEIKFVKFSPPMVDEPLEYGQQEVDARFLTAFKSGSQTMHDILMPIIEMQRDVLCLLDHKIEHTTFYVGQNLTSSSEVISECLEQTDKMLKGE